MYLKYINLSEKEYSEFNNNDTPILKFEKTNIFIGKNNSGKSRLIRNILIKEYDKKYYVNDDVENFIELKSNIEELIQNANDYTLKKYSQTYLSSEIIKDKIYRSEEDEEKLGYFICNLISSEDGNTTYSKLQSARIIKNNYVFQRDSNIVVSAYKGVLKNKIKNCYNKIIDNKQDVVPMTLFFPSFLSLRKLNNNSGEQQSYHSGMSNMFYSEYFQKIKDFENRIKTGQEIFADMKKQLLGLNKDREQFLKYEKYIGDNFFDKKQISVFIKDDDNNIYIKEENEDPYPIYMLGDGLQTLITITYYLFMNQDKPLKVFIDEPEIHLHPGLQRLLISKLQEYDNCQFFISTHSSNMIDICDEYEDDISIICVEKNNLIKKAYNSVYNNMNLFDLIGVRPSSIILSNCTIWVEGPTDIYYIETFLKLYIKLKNKKSYSLGYNYNYAFNGSINIASKIDFDNDTSATVKINKLSKNNFVIFDSDNLNSENANFQKIEKLKSKLGESCFVIRNLRTIENIILPGILYKYYENNYNSKDRRIKPLVLEFFNKLMKEYGNTQYFKKDIADEMAEYINKHIIKKDIKKYRKYCNNLWNSNKYNLAIFFSNMIENEEIEQQNEIFDRTMGKFIDMIKKIYTFIENNN